MERNVEVDGRMRRGLSDVQRWICLSKVHWDVEAEQDSLICEAENGSTMG